MREILVLPGKLDVSELLDTAADEDLLLRSSDGREFLLHAVDAFAEEVARTRENQELMALLDERRKEAGGVPWEQVAAELGLDPADGAADPLPAKSEPSLP